MSRDSRNAISRYLARNPALSFVAREEGQLVAAVLAGTDGRRGYLQHPGPRTPRAVLRLVAQ